MYRTVHTSVTNQLVCLSQFSDQLEGMLDTLASTAEQLDHAEAISAQPDKLRDQLLDNQAVIEDMEKRLAALDAVRATAGDLIDREGMDNDAAQGK